MITATVAVLALLLLVVTLQDAFEVMLLPRRVMRRLRFVSLFYRLTAVPTVFHRIGFAAHRRPSRPYLDRSSGIEMEISP